MDDFIDESNRSARGQSTTLSLVDLAELKATMPAGLSSFAKDTAGYIKNKEYNKVSTARTASREFAKSSNIDQVDLVNLVYNLEQNESNATVQSVLGAVKYNRTSSNMANSYGLSIYFPYKKLSKVDRMVQTYGDIRYGQRLYQGDTAVCIVAGERTDSRRRREFTNVYT